MGEWQFAGLGEGNGVTLYNRSRTPVLQDQLVLETDDGDGCNNGIVLNVTELYT
jgi:hypothetical protein